MSHPCAGHMATCDHCFCCEKLHICCATIPIVVRERLEADVAPPPDPLYAAVLAHAKTVRSLPELVRQEAARAGALPASSRLGLLSGRLAEPIPSDSRKEAIHAIPPRTSR